MHAQRRDRQQHDRTISRVAGHRVPPVFRDRPLYTPCVRVRPAAAHVLSVIAAACCPALLASYREGPVPAVTGGFGEPTCLKCHFDNSLNESHGSLAVDGVPRIYIPGREYELKVVLRRSGL